MDYIEISDGVSLCVDDIEAVIRNEDILTCTVKTSNNIYQSTFPYEVFLGLLGRYREEPKEYERKEELNILKTLGTYAG